MEEAEWATETLKSTGKVVATTVTMCPQGDWQGKISPEEAAVRIAKAGEKLFAVFTNSQTYNPWVIFQLQFVLCRIKISHFVNQPSSLDSQSVSQSVRETVSQ